MSYSVAEFNQLIDWVNNTRTHSHRLNLEADGILARIIPLCYRQRQIQAMSEAPVTFGLYGNSVAGKNHLLKMILAEGSEEINMQLGENTLNYLRHINPDNRPSSMAIRFTSAQPPTVENFPLQLTLFSESELAQRLIRQYHSSAHPHVVCGNTISAMVAELQSRSRPQPEAGLTREQMSSVLLCYHQVVGSLHRLDDSLVYQLSDLAPRLRLADRARLLSLFWGEYAVFTTQWQQMAQTLRYLGHASRLLAPTSLIVDNLLQPNKDFLFEEGERDRGQNNDVIVCPLIPGEKQAPMSIAQQDLARICAEICFMLAPKASLKAVDIVDIPDSLLHYYQDRLQPDTLLICNACEDIQQLLPTARMLAEWAKQTQSQHQRSLPRLVWAITPFDLRFTQGNHTSNAIQRFISLSGISWGTLQVFDRRDTASLNEWLSAVIGSSSHAERVIALQDDLREQVRTLFGRFHQQTTSDSDSMRKQVEGMIRTLQAQAEKHGELIDQLTLSRDIIQQCWLQAQPKEGEQPAALMPSIDLFDDSQSGDPTERQEKSFATKVFSLWINHLFRLSQQPMGPAFSWLQQRQFQTLCAILLDTAYRLELPQTLEKSLAPYSDNAAMAITHAGNVISDFISWLGYDSVAQEQRPLSKICKGAPIFTPAQQADIHHRLTRLGNNMLQDNARYIFDWMVALLTRAVENAEVGVVNGLNEEQSATLQGLLKR